MQVAVSAILLRFLWCRLPVSGSLCNVPGSPTEAGRIQLGCAAWFLRGPLFPSEFGDGPAQRLGRAFTPWGVEIPVEAWSPRRVPEPAPQVVSGRWQNRLSP